MKRWLTVALALAHGSVHASNPYGVDPFIGTGGGGAATPISGGPGNTFPGALVPFGMVSVSPHNDLHAPSGYRAGAPRLYGFGQVHLSGVGCPDLGNILVAATTGALKTTAAGYASRYANEVAWPGYYKVDLADSSVRAEATATTRAGLLRFTFPARHGDANLIVDVGHALARSVAGRVRIVSDDELEGWDKSGGFCGMDNRQTVHFVARFSKPARARGTFRGATPSAREAEEGTDLGAWLRFDTAAGEPILVKLGISYVSVENARANLDREIPGWDFDGVRRAAGQAWTEALSRIRVVGGSHAERTRFYTALYHMLIHPNVFSDANGDYPSMRNGSIRRAEGYTRYSVFSLWDTYRLEHPFLALVYPERQLDMVRSMIEMYREGGWLPKWELAGNETHVMVGDPAAIVIADSWLRGVRGFDVDTAWEAVRKHASTGAGNDIRPGAAAYLRWGFIPEDDHDGEWVFGSVSTALEYALADWALARFADGLGHKAEAAAWRKRAGAYQRYFDPALDLLRPRNRDGSWLTPFDPRALCCDKPWPESGGPGFVEGNAWHYTFFVPHDLAGLERLFGGPAAFVDRLQTFFEQGMFSLGNEPDLGFPYLFTVVDGEAWRTQRLVRELLGRFGDGPSGLPGNDDAGVLSAWYVWSAIGLYPLCPASNEYAIGSPLFERVTLSLSPRFHRGGSFTIDTANQSPSSPYVRAAWLDGAPHHGSRLDHERLVRGGTLLLDMSPEP
jgi:predicted alpha-1,2-mannosidase